MTQSSRHSANHSPIEILRHFLGDIVYGASDGIVTTFTIVSGVVGAQFRVKVLLVIGIVSLLADGFSMGAARYLSIRAQDDLRRKRRGLLDPLSHAIATFIAFVLFGMIPLLGFVISGAMHQRFLISCISTGIALLLLGLLRGVISKRKLWRTSLEMILIGAFAALVAYYLGAWLSGWLG